jgi:hypothetical protein
MKTHIASWNVEDREAWIANRANDAVLEASG